MADPNDVEIARHEVRLEQVAAELNGIRRDVEREREQRIALQRVVDDIMRWGAVARVIFIGAVALGGFGSWILGITDHVRRLFASHN